MTSHLSLLCHITAVLSATSAKVLTFQPHGISRNNPQDDILNKLPSRHLTLKNTPTFCKSHPCPDFVTLRQYNPSAQWVSTTPIDNLFRFPGFDDYIRMYFTISAYKFGSNAAGATLAHTVPVVTKIQRGGILTWYHSMSFYVSEASPPAPTNRDLSLGSLHSDMYVRSFPSFVESRDGMFMDVMEDLRETLKENGLQYNPDVSYHVRYDMPWDVFRYNEVWIPVALPES